jgi:hypothetical protein
VESLTSQPLPATAVPAEIPAEAAKAAEAEAAVEVAAVAEVEVEKHPAAAVQVVPDLVAVILISRLAAPAVAAQVDLAPAPVLLGVRAREALARVAPVDRDPVRAQIPAAQMVQAVRDLGPVQVPAARVVLEKGAPVRVQALVPAALANPEVSSSIQPVLAVSPE